MWPFKKNNKHKHGGVLYEPSEKREIKESVIDEKTGEMFFQMLIMLDRQWIQIDDVIKWLKHNDKICDGHYHDLVKNFVRMKNRHKDA